MSQFVVDRDSLLAARAELAVLRDQLLTMHVAIWAYWGQLGGRELEGELEHFCGTWHWGATEIAARIDSVAVRLQEAADAYERIEQRVKHASSEPQSAPAGRVPRAARRSLRPRSVVARGGRRASSTTAPLQSPCIPSRIIPSHDRSAPTAARA